jgi:two-component system LytT family response regulator
VGKMRGCDHGLHTGKEKEMKILAADDEEFALSSVAHAIRQAQPDAELLTVSSAEDALQAISRKGYIPDVAFLDIKMPGMSGLELAKRIREASPQTNIIFVTAYSDYALEAYSIRPSGYLSKPVTPEQVREELENLRYPVQNRPKKGLRVQCFGNFEVFANERPVNFAYQKTKELFAYLVDRRGAACNTAELCAVLWEDKPDTPELRKYLRKLLADLWHTLEDVDAKQVIAKGRNSFAVVPGEINCDYYQFLNREIAAINTYTGEYMTQYSWADMTLGTLWRTQE